MATTADNPSTTAPTEPTPVKGTIVVSGESKEPESVAPSAPDSTTTAATTQEESATSSTIDESKAGNGEALLEAGRKLIAEQNYSDAVSILSNAMEIAQKNNIATSIEAVPYYMLYGEALLRYVQSSNDLFAAPVRESQQQHLDAVEEEQEEDQDDDDDDMVQPVVDATVADNEKEEEETETAETEKAGNPKDEQDDEEDDGEAQPEEEAESVGHEEEEEQAANGDVDTTEDREIAWESFEYARSIIEEFVSKPENTNNDKYLKLLANCHSFIGELLIEDENNESALAEFCEALKVQDRCSEGFIKCRPRAFNHFMACLAAQFCNKDEEALDHCKVALTGLSERICGLLQSMQCDEELKESEDYAQIVKVSETFMEKMDEAQKKSEDATELRELVGVMTDLMAKLEEVEETMQRKKERAEAGEDEQGQADGNKNGDVMSMMKAADPLQALIMGLTSKFGIDEQALAALEQEEEEAQDDKENVDDTEKENVGVTTIGFGNAKVDDDDEPVNELGSFGSKSKTERKSGKKRSLEDAEIDTTEDDTANSKKMKLNSGDAAVMEQQQTK